MRFDNTILKFYRNGMFVCTHFGLFSSLSSIFNIARKNGFDLVCVSCDGFYGEYKIYKKSIKKIYSLWNKKK